MLRHFLGSFRLSRSFLPMRGLEEFYPLQAGKNKQTTTIGGDWKAWMLREKSTEDIHKLWYVLLKERNALLTEKQECKMRSLTFPNAARKQKVKKSMARIKLILHERSRIHQTKQSAIAKSE